MRVKTKPTTKTKPQITAGTPGGVSTTEYLAGTHQPAAAELPPARGELDLNSFLTHWLPLLDAWQLQTYFALGLTGNLDTRRKSEAQLISDCQRVANIGAITLRRCIRALKMLGLIT